MRTKILIGMAFLFTLSEFACVEASAGERATTEVLPPALAALGADASKILNQDEASQIRGDGWVLALTFDNLRIRASGYGSLVVYITTPRVHVRLVIGNTASP